MIYVRSLLVVKELNLPTQEPISIALGGEHDIKVSLRSPSTEEQLRGYPSGTGLCLAVGRYETNSPVPALAGEAKQASESGEESVSWEDLSQDTQDFLSAVQTELSDIARRIVLSWRWRTGASGPHDPFSSGGYEWSRDGVSWAPIPLNLVVHGEVIYRPKVSPSIMADVKAIVADGESEPLHHKLFRDAWEHRLRSPTTALIIGMSALEVGVKSYVSAVVPSAAWLIEEAQSPPVDRILREYLPSLPPPSGRRFQVPKKVLRRIELAIPRRNKAAHLGESGLSYDDLEEVLLSVKDTLWLLDYSTGREWALDHVREATRRDLASIVA